jgi:UDP-2,3-diacylglucosamine pyrophosphatase LpxH
MAQRSKRIVVLSDLQIPYQDNRAVTATIEFIADYKPDELWCVGDELDAPEPSRWNKGMLGEYADTLQDSIDLTNQIMSDYKQALGKNKPFYVQRSNHTDRIDTYIRKFAPAFSSLTSLKIEELLGYKKLGITYLHKMQELLPGWVMAHGDEGSLNRAPGATALNLAKRLGKSVVCGHTHRVGLQHETTGFYGKTNTLYGLEVGHMMDMSQASYLTSGSANWQQGIGILVQKNNKVTPFAVPIVNGEVIIP